MKYKRLLGVLLAALLVSCLFSLLMFMHQSSSSAGKAHWETFYFAVALATLPGAFVAMIVKGMCNARTATGIAIATLVNMVFYFVPLLVLAAIIEMRMRKKRENDEASTEESMTDARTR